MIAEASLRPDAERLRRLRSEGREPDRLLVHFLLERALAARLKAFPAAERASRYPEIYGALFAGLPDHPQHAGQKASRREKEQNQLRLLRPLVGPASVFVEIGCGDAGLSRALAPEVREAVGVDVTAELIDFAAAPAHFRFVRTGGIALGLVSGSVDLVYSNQLMEHLHPDDAAAQLAEIHRILAPGGAYLCITPNRLTGPHDISCYFGYEPCGLHLREYDHGSLAAMFRAAGFSGCRACVTAKGRIFMLPLAPVRLAEFLLGVLPRAVRTRVINTGPVQNLGGVAMLARK